MMDRILKRPMFRMGGRSDDGIMSLRPGFQEGGFFSRLGSGALNLLKRGGSKALSLFPEEGILSSKGVLTRAGSQAITQFPKTAGGILMAAPFVPVAALADENYPVYPKGHPKEGERMSIKDAQETLEKTGGAMNIATGKGTQAGGAGDIAGEAAMFDLDLPKESGGMFDIFGNMKYPTKRTFDKPEAIEVSKEIGLLPKDEDTPDPDKDPPKPDKGDDTPSDEDTMESYLKMFREAAGDDPEQTRRERFLELARFGANLLAQPGGDLVGAVGRAAAPSIEGLARSAAASKQTDKEVRLAALKLAIDKMDNPTADKIKTLARLSGLDEKEIARTMIQDPTSDTTKESIITTNQAAMEQDIGKGPALKAARTMAEAGLNFGLFSLLPKDKKGKIKEDVADGFYYDDKGNLFKIEAGVSTPIKLTS